MKFVKFDPEKCKFCTQLCKFLPILRWKGEWTLYQLQKLLEKILNLLTFESISASFLPGAPTRLQNYDCSRLCFTFSIGNLKNLPKKFQKQQQLWNFQNFSTFTQFFRLNFCVTSWMSKKSTSLGENLHEICEFHGTFFKNCAIFFSNFFFFFFFFVNFTNTNELWNRTLEL